MPVPILCLNEHLRHFKEANESQQQPYDRALKSLLEDHAAEMIAELVPESRLIEERNSELTRLNLRADIVYLIEYKGKHHILHMELQTEAEKEMALRMLVYHLELFIKFRLPVISVVLYPFETPIAEPVFQTDHKCSRRKNRTVGSRCLCSSDVTSDQQCE